MSAAPLAPPLRDLTKSELRAMGVPAPLVASVRAAASREDLRALPLEGDLAARLETLFFQHDRARGRADDVDADSLLRLDDAQRAIVARIVSGGPYRLRGVAGTGKTQVLLHAATQRLAARPPARDLFWTYNRALADRARLSVSRLAGTRARELTLETFDAWCKRFLGETRPIRDDRHPELLELLDLARERARAASWAPDSPLWAREPDFWREELDYLRDHPLETLADYLEVERVGRGRRLDRAHRPLVWVTYETFVKLLDERGVRDWRQVRLDALRRLRETRATRYERVFVDEAQDLPPLALKVAALLAGTSVAIAVDGAQAIYRKGFRWRDLGLAQTRSFTLTTCYRTTAEIARVGEPFRSPEDDPLAGRTLRSGLRPAVVTVTGRGNEAEWVADELRRRLAQGARPGSMAVLSFTRRQAAAVADALERRGLQVSRSTDALDLAGAAIKVATMSSTKGLEWEVVFLAPLCDADFSPRPSGDDEDEQRLETERRRKVLYVAMTRARDEVVLVQRRGNAARILAEIPADAVRTP